MCVFAVIPVTVATLEKSELYDVIVERGPVLCAPLDGGGVVSGRDVAVCPGVAEALGCVDGVAEGPDGIGVPVGWGSLEFGGRTVGGGRSGLSGPDGVSGSHSTPPGPIPYEIVLPKELVEKVESVVESDTN